MQRDPSGLRFLRKAERYLRLSPRRESRGARALYRSRMSLEMQMNSVPTILNVSDMELFDHFRKTAYPYIPVGNDEVWTTEIPRLAQTVSSNALVALFKLCFY